MSRPTFPRLLAAILMMSPVAFAGAPKPRLDRHGQPLPAEAVARIGTPTLRHPWALYSAAFSPDGKLFAGGTVEALVIWDVATLQPRITLKVDHRQVMTSRLVFSPDSTMLLSSSRGSPSHGPQRDLTFLWDLKTAKEIRLFGKADMLAGAFSADGRYLAASFHKEDGAIRLWDLRNNREVRRFDDSVEGVQHMAITANGKNLFGCTWLGELYCWDTETGKQRFSRKYSGGQLSTDGAYCLAARGPVVIDPMTEEIKCKLPRPSKGYAFECFGADRKTLIRVEPEQVILWDLTTGEEKDTIPLPKSDNGGRGLGSAALSPDGKTLALSYHSQTRIYDLTLPADKRERGWLQEPAYHLHFSPDDRTLLCCNWPPQYPIYYPRFFTLWDVKTGAPVRPQMRLDQTYLFQFLDKGERLLFAGYDQFDIQETRTGKALFGLKQITGPALLTHNPLPPPLWVSKDGQTMMRPLYDLKKPDLKNSRLQLIRVKDDKVLREIKVEGGAPVVLPDGQTLFTFQMEDGGFLGKDDRDFPNYVASESVTAWNVSDGKKRFTIEDKRRDKENLRQQPGLATTPPPRLLAFSPDGKQFAWYQDGPHVHVADLATGQTLRTLPRELGMQRMSFSYDGKMLALDGGGPALWEVVTGKPRHTFTGNDHPAFGIGFSHDGSLLAAGHADTTVLLWDIWGIHTVKRTAALSDAELDKVWSELTVADARKAFAAMRRLRQHAEESVPLMKNRLDKLAREAGINDIPKLVLDLESNVFRTRAAAEEKLRQFGAIARPALHRAVSGLPTLEGRRRAERILNDIASPPTGSWLQALRAVELLESIPGDAARQALQALSHNDVSHPLTMEVKASLERRQKVR